jgi:ElaB/YqjD/DUF883 family membrane-anchored ribosome-binding protein
LLCGIVKETTMAESNFDEEFGQIRADLRDLRAQVGDLASRIREGETDGIPESLREGRKRLRRSANAMRDRGREYTENLEQRIGAHPESSLAIAFGAGYLAAKLVDGRRH